MRIAILGGGPGGLLAALLARRGDPRREVTVFERNRAGDTFGFGVVFSDATLDGIDAADPVLRRALAEHGVHWDPIEVRLRGERWRFGGNGMAAVARQTLLTLLQQRAAQAGADLRFSSPVQPDDLLSTDDGAGYDLVIAADGANSQMRARFAEAFGPSVVTATAKFIWFGTTYPFGGLTFVHEQGPHGVFAVHGYPIGNGVSTFIVETDERSWREAGLDAFDVSQPPGPSDQVTQAYLEKLFATQIDGCPLLVNNSRWGNFRTWRTQRWRHRAGRAVARRRTRRADLRLRRPGARAPDQPGRDPRWPGGRRGSQVQVAGTAGDRGRIARHQGGQAGQEGAPRPAEEQYIMTDIETPPTTGTFDSAEHQARLKELYADFEAAGMTPLWLTREGLMPFHPQPRAVPHLWRWADLLPLAARSAELVPVGRGGERRAISLGNPGLTGDPYTTPTLWAAIQYLAPREDAPEHRHTQSAFRFVLEGEGVWTVVDGDPVAMRRGDLLLTPGWAFHGHQNVSDTPMAWLDGLDIPLVAETDQGFFEFGPDQVRNRATPDRSASERLWGQPGLTPVALAGTRPASPLVAYRWSHTDAALAAQLEIEGEGLHGVLEPGHAAVRYTNPASGGDALTTMRTEFHRLAAGAVTRRSRTSASSVWQVFDGTGSVRLNDSEHPLERGDVIAVPAWTEFSLTAVGQLDLFTFSDAPVFEKLNLLRTEIS